MIMNCKYCKREIPENSIFCNWCGKKQIKDTAVKVPQGRRLADGTYIGQVMVGGQRVTVHGANERDYIANATAIKSGLVEVKRNPGKMTLKAAIDKYFAANEAVLSPSTVRGYYINSKQLSQWYEAQTGILDLQQVVSALTEKYSPKTVSNIYGFICSVYKYNKIPHDDVTLPAKVRAEREFLDDKQIDIFLRAVYGKKIELAALLALHSLRESEILAMSADSVKDGHIRVSGAVVPDKNNKAVRKDSNKTLSSNRSVPVMIGRLQELWDGLNGADPVFPAAQNIRRDINRVCKKAGLPEVGCHGLRHSFCSLAFYLEWDIKSVCAVGGWSSPDVPMRVYRHLSQRQQTADIVKMTEFFK